LPKNKMANFIKIYFHIFEHGGSDKVCAMAESVISGR